MVTATVFFLFGLGIGVLVGVIWIIKKIFRGLKKVKEAVF